MTAPPAKILTLSGSLQELSSNAALVRAAERVAPESVELVVHGSLGDLPLLNPELDGEGDTAPEPVRRLREPPRQPTRCCWRASSTAIACRGYSKNALDWLVASGELSGMRVGLISASPTVSGGINARIALARTLMAVAVSLTVLGVKAKLDDRGELAHGPTLRRVRETLVALGEAAEERREWLARYE